MEKEKETNVGRASESGRHGQGKKRKGWMEKLLKIQRRYMGKIEVGSML